MTTVLISTLAHSFRVNKVLMTIEPSYHPLPIVYDSAKGAKCVYIRIDCICLRRLMLLGI
jgi:hypothetical protein